MSWLFGKKKVVPKIPFPEGKSFSEKTLQFSKSSSEDRVIEPTKIQAAAGLEKPIVPPPEPIEPVQEDFAFPSDVENEQTNNFSLPVEPFSNQKMEPLYIKMDVYQRILEELGEIKKNLSTLKGISTNLVKSEYNEEHHFVKLKKITKTMHDKLLQADKIIFKGD